MVCSITYAIGWLLIILTLLTNGTIFRLLIFAGRLIGGIGVGFASLCAPVSFLTCVCFNNYSDIDPSQSILDVYCCANILILILLLVLLNAGRPEPILLKIFLPDFSKNLFHYSFFILVTSLSFLNNADLVSIASHLVFKMLHGK